MKKICKFFVTCMALCAVSALAEKLSLVTVDFPPYSYQDGAEIKGIEVEIVKRMCETAGIEYTISLLPFARAVENIKDFKNSNQDALFNFYKNPDRLKIFEYSDQLLENPLVFFVRRDATLDFSGDLNAFAGKTIGTMLGYTYSPAFSAAIQDKVFKVEEAPTHEANLRKLQAGRIDAYPIEKNVGLYFARKLGMADEFKILATPLIVQQGFMGIAKDNPKAQLLPKLNAALQTLRASGEYDSIFKRYMGN